MQARSTLFGLVKARRPDGPVFMIAAFSDKGTVAAELEQGANKVLTKPLNFRRLKLDVAAVIAEAPDAP